MVFFLLLLFFLFCSFCAVQDIRFIVLMPPRWLHSAFSQVVSVTINLVSLQKTSGLLLFLGFPRLKSELTVYFFFLFLKELPKWTLNDEACVRGLYDLNGVISVKLYSPFCMSYEYDGLSHRLRAVIPITYQRNLLF